MRLLFAVFAFAPSFAVVELVSGARQLAVDLVLDVALWWVESPRYRRQVVD